MTTCRTYNRSKNFAKYCEDLENRGAIQLSFGAYSRVFMHPEKKNVVIKVADIERRRPDGWFHYAKFLIDNKIRNPHVPRIYTLIRYRNMYVATMERLKPFKTTNKDHVAAFRMLDRDLWSLSSRSRNPKHQNLKRLLNKMGTHKAFRKLDPDLHYDNVMVRRKVLVLTDPFCGDLPFK